MSLPATSPISLTFAELALAAPILQAIQEVGYEVPSPIQAESIPPLLAGRDLIGQAQTGTGKTAAFALPLLSRLDINCRQPQILVLTPTRELALQVAEAFQTYARHLPGFHVLPVYGGQSMSGQLRQLSRGAHVIVGTPGRVMDHLRRKSLVLSKLSAVVLDEADEMLRMGFIDDVDWILEQTPAQRQVALFSATMPTAIRKVAQRHLKDPLEVKIHTKTSTVSSISQRYWQVTNLHKLDALTRILEAEDFDAMLIFVRTKTATTELAEKLEARGYECGALNGDMNQTLREKTIERLKKGDLDIVVATDVAARGLDVDRISHVLNYDIPNDTESYVHRIGRTGRAGRTGSAILFVTPREKRLLRAIEVATRQPITMMKLPSHEDIADRRINQFKQQLSETIESQDLAFFEEFVDQYQQEQDITMNEIAAALVYLVQRERPLLPELAEISMDTQDDEPSSARPRRDREERGAPRSYEREDRPERPAARRKAHSDENLVCYRLDVGREHGVQPKHIVGAIANEAGLDSQFIGHIKLYDTYSTVDLPDGMPKEVFAHLQNVRVCNRKLGLTRFDEASGDSEDSSGHGDKPESAAPRRGSSYGGSGERSGERPMRLNKPAGAAGAGAAAAPRKVIRKKKPE